MVAGFWLGLHCPRIGITNWVRELTVTTILNGEANVIRSFSSKSPESYAVTSVVVGILMAAVLTQIPAFAFGAFWQMAVAFVVADIVVYAMMKIGWLKGPGARS